MMKVVAGHVPGIGVLSALAYVSTVEDPGRFGRSRSVGAHLGLTPRQYESGEVDPSGRISRCGDTLARTLRRRLNARTHKREIVACGSFSCAVSARSNRSR